MVRALTCMYIENWLHVWKMDECCTSFLLHQLSCNLLGQTDTDLDKITQEGTEYTDILYMYIYSASPLTV